MEAQYKLVRIISSEASLKMEKERKESWLGMSHNWTN